MAGPEPLHGQGLRAYQHMVRKLGRVLELLDHATVAEVVANYVFRVVVHGAETAIAEHHVPSSVARGIAVGLFHAAALRRLEAKRGRNG